MLGAVVAKRSKKITLAGHGYDGKFEEGERVIPDPLEAGQRYTARVNVRESAIAHMASRGRINTAQEAAGERFRKLWEQAGIGNNRAMDPAKEFVDGGTLGDPLSDELVKASLELAKAMQALGQVGCRILIGIVGEGKRIEDVAAEWSKGGGPVTGRRAEGYVTGTMVDALNALVAHWRLEAEGVPANDAAWYLRNGMKIEVRDDIRASGPITVTGPAREVTIGRFGEAVVIEKRPLDRGPMSEHVSGTASSHARSRRK